tara:strand:+ start:301 stop:1563 length:1263 start_codon:yes stop_codon:yes gene_type:complete
MKLLIKSATLVDNTSDLNFKVKDILIEDGFIADISDKIESKADKLVKHKNLHISNGWLDTSVSFGEPGYEERENIQNGLNTASSSGFTSLLLNPNTEPLIDSHSSVSHLIKKSKNHTSTLYPIGNLTLSSQGKKLAPLYDMKLAGAIAYGDHKKAINDSSLLKIALEYSKGFGGIVISYPNDDSLSSKGVMNEGIVSTSLGLKGMPNISESIQIYRDLEILEYTGGKLHIPYVSTGKSISMIKDAKKKGLNITSSVSLAHLVLNDTDLSEYNTNLKLSPPLRSKKDSDLLKDALLDGTIDYVTSMHEPIDIDNKKVEFDNALPGSIGLECMFGSLLNIFPLDKAIDILTRGKEKLSIIHNEIKIGSKAEITLFDPDFTYTFKEDHILSTSKNCAFIGQKMTGKVFGVINNNNLFENRLWI